ncbi:hypothetical protein MYA_2077 [Burkholderia sp. KJ006]|nr:hypothetical protein MYA_2077 [Burkholderia sp. KJ006]
MVGIGTVHPGGRRSAGLRASTGIVVPNRRKRQRRRTRRRSGRDRLAAWRLTARAACGLWRAACD